MELLTGLGLASVLLVVWFTWHTARSGAGPLAAIIEAWINVAYGFTLNFTANLWIIPLMSPGGHMSAGRNFWGGCFYTALSVCRTYTVRIYLGARIHAWALKLAANFR